jgi:OOP family OmpA-OmpF porin
MNAQTEAEKTTTEDFNKWSIEASGGFNKTERPTTAGAFTTSPSPFTVDLGVRYMFNNKFGLKADAGYNKLTSADGSNSFDTRYYRVALQAVANLGRIMSFETWTNTIGLLGHAGVGVAQLEDQNSALKDRMGNVMGGLTAQIKLSDRVALTLDGTVIVTADQDAAWDALSTPSANGFSGVMYNATAGLQIYLGKHSKHADWTYDNQDRIESLENRVSSIETKMVDTDNDGVADYLDQEPNSAAGALVSTKGVSVDANNNNVPDDVENYIMKNYTNKNDKSPMLANNELITSLINGGYVATYFDFNKSTPTSVSAEGIDFILMYLRNNPSATIDITGHADEIGSSSFNKNLSNARANNVKNVLVKANIAASRLNVIAAGEDNSVNKNSEAARKLVRKVTYTVK